MKVWVLVVTDQSERPMLVLDAASIVAEPGDRKALLAANDAGGQVMEELLRLRTDGPAGSTPASR